MKENLSALPNETIRTIHKRHSVRVFAKEPITEQQITTLLQAANEAPSAHNKQSWRFVILTGQKTAELSQIVSQKADAFPRPASALLRMATRSIASAPAVIAVLNTGELIEHGTELFKVEKDMARDFFRVMEIQSSAAAVQNMLLAATSLGLGTVWLSILYLIKDEISNFLGEPSGEFMAVIPVGHPVRETGGPQKDPLDMKVRFLG
ncbi:MAG: nitroreductase family protein [Nitrospirae bacterium]|nr:nitroreductase family protein [Nitrospirota bacterium]